MVTRRGEIRLVSRRAARWLETLRAAPRSRRPAALARRAARGPGTPFGCEAKGLRLVVTVADETRKGSRYLILENAGPAPRLPLSAREEEVLDWVEGGKTNEEIAALLRIKPCTVKKHLERIYQKLGVDNRTAAVSFLHTGPR